MLSLLRTDRHVVCMGQVVKIEHSSTVYWTMFQLASVISMGLDTANTWKQHTHQVSSFENGSRAVHM